MRATDQPFSFGTTGLELSNVFGRLAWNILYVACITEQTGISNDEAISFALNSNDDFHNNLSAQASAEKAIRGLKFVVH